MRILYAAPMYDYGAPSRGYSAEHYSFYHCLSAMGHDIIYFDTLSEKERYGAAASSVRLRNVVQAEKPDLLFCVLFTDELRIDTISGISRSSDTVTFNWFCDDHWRFEGFSRHWAPAFNWVSTTAEGAMTRYRAIGCPRVIKTQWACNHFLYRPSGAGQEYDVTFVGQPYGNRREMVDAVRAAGIDIRVWGEGWEMGRLAQEEVVRTFSVSRVNLNFSASSSHGTVEPRWKRGLRRVARRPRPFRSQIKARTFEVPGCGGFLLTEAADGLEEYYQPEIELATFRTPRDLVRQVNYYLDHCSRRESAALAGYRRTMAEHTLERRLNDIFSALGLDCSVGQCALLSDSEKRPAGGSGARCP